MEGGREGERERERERESQPALPSRLDGLQVHFLVQALPDRWERGRHGSPRWLAMESEKHEEEEEEEEERATTGDTRR